MSQVYFTFSSVTGSNSSIISPIITELPSTTASVSSYNTVYGNYNNNIVVTFNNSQSSIPTLGSCSNGIVSNITGAGTTFSFNWNPISSVPTSFTFTNVSGYVGTLTSGNTITPVVTTVTVSGTSTQGISCTVTAIFNITQLVTPVLGTCSNGGVFSISGSGTFFTFTWISATTAPVYFNFILSYGGTISSINSLTPIPLTYLLSITPTSCNINLSNTMTAVFSNNLTSLPFITIPNGSITGSTYSGNTVTFNWVPSVIGYNLIFQFSSVTGTPNTLSLNTVNVTYFSTVNMVVWFDTSQSSTLSTITNNSTVTYWNNAITGNALSQLTPYSTGPTYISSLSSFNNKPALQFTGTGIQLRTLSYQSTGQVIPPNFTLFLVFNMTSSSSNSSIVNFNNGGSLQVNSFFSSTTNQIGFESTGGTLYASVPLALTFGQTYIYTIIGTSTSTELRINNTYTSGIVPTAMNTSTDFCIGGEVNGTSWYYTGYVSEIMVYNTNLSSASINATYSYLATKYNISTSIVSITPNVFYNVSNTMNVIFNILLQALPTIIPPSGTVSGASYSNNIVTFNWTPTISTGTVTFQFSGITGYTGVLTSNTVLITSQPMMLGIYNMTCSTSYNYFSLSPVLFNTLEVQFMLFNLSGTNGFITNSTYGLPEFTLNLTNNNFTFSSHGGTSSASYNLGTWYHMVITNVYTNTSYQIYMNGILSLSFGGTCPAYSTPAYIFYDTDGSTNSQQNIYMKNYRLWNSVQNPLTLYSNMNVVYTSSTPGLVSQYLFANNLLDTSGNNNTLTWTGESTSLSYLSGSFDGTLFHLDAQNYSSLTLNGSNVMGWTDTSGNNVMFIPNGSPPVYNPSLINGFPGLDFSNSAGLVSVNPIESYQNCTIIMVVITTANITAYGMYFAHGANTQFEVNRNNTNSTIKLLTNGDLLCNLNYTVGTPTIYFGTMIGGTIRFFESVTAAGVTTTTATNTLSMTFGTNYVYIGTYNNSIYCNSYIGEMIYYRYNLSNSARDTIIANLMAKWQIGCTISPINCYSTIVNAMTVVFPFTQTALPTITQPNGTVSGSAYSGTQVTFNWTPNTTGAPLQFSFTGVTGQAGTVLSGNLSVFSTTSITSVVPTIFYVGVQNSVVVTFNNNLLTLPTIIVPNGSITGSYYILNNLFFYWTPASAGTTLQLQFTSVTGYTGTLTYSGSTIGWSVGGTSTTSTTTYTNDTVTTGGAYTNYAYVPGLILSGNIYFEVQLKSTFGSGTTLNNDYFGIENLASVNTGQYANHTGMWTTINGIYMGTLIGTSSYYTTYSTYYSTASIPSGYILGYAVNFTSKTATYYLYNGSGTLLVTQTYYYGGDTTYIPTNSVIFLEGSDSSISAQLITPLVSRIPPGYNPVTLNNQITVIASTTLSNISPMTGIYTGVQVFMTVTFNNILYGLPTITPPNGTIIGAYYTGYNVYFFWTPSTAGTFTFSFTNVTGTTSTLTSGNITASNISSTILVSLNPTSVTTGVVTVMMATFNISLTALPTITPFNGSTSGSSNSGANVVFNWTPALAGTGVFTFTSVTGASGTLTSGVITVGNPTLLVSLTPINVTCNVLTNMTAIFSNTISAVPTITVQSSNGSGTGTVSNSSYISTSSVFSGINVIFSWTPSTTGIFTIFFSGVTGALTTLTSGNITVGTTLLITPLPTLWMYPASPSTTNVQATSIFSTSFYAYFAISNTTLLTGANSGNAWIGNGVNTNLKFIVMFDTPFIATYMVLNNPHNVGSAYQQGIQSFNIYGSNNNIVFTNIGTYSDETSMTFIGNFTARQHLAVDMIDQQVFVLNNTNIYQYYILKISNSWGDSSNMGIRRIQFFQTLPTTFAPNVPYPMYFIFSDPLPALPTITPPNGTITSSSYVNNYVTFTWTPSTICTNKQFTFSGITTASSIFTSGNISVQYNTITSMSPTNIYNTVLTPITVVFISPIMAVPLIVPPNGSINGSTYLNNILYFNWTPTTVGTFSFTFTNVSYSSGTLTQGNITVISAPTTLTTPTMLISIAPTSITNAVTQAVIATFNISLTAAPTITAPNGTIAGITNSGANVEFTWTPTTLGIFQLQFTSVTGASGTLTSGYIYCTEHLIY